MFGPELEAARAFAEARMGDTCEVQYDTGQTVKDGRRELPVYATRFTSKCRVRPSRASDTFEAGGATHARAAREVHLPAGAGQVEPGDFIVFTQVAADSDPYLVGKRWRVITPAAASQTTAKRLQVEEES